MDPATIAWACTVLMIALMVAGVPVAVAMLATATVGMYAAAGWNFTLSTLSTLPYAAASSYNFAALPMFVAMGIAAGSIGIIGDLFRSANMWLAKVRGGLYMATISASGAFGAVNGSTVVGAALFTRVALPEMNKLKYDRKVSAGCIAAAGTFAAMIPPSISMVLYGLLTDESIGRILMAGILPGVLTIVVYLIGIGIMVRIRSGWAPPPIRDYSRVEKMRSLRSVLPVVFIALVVIGGIYSGTVSPSAAGAVGAFGVLIVGLFMRRVSKKMIVETTRETAAITGVLFFIVIGGLAYSRLLLTTGVVDDLLELIRDSGFQPWAFMLCLVAIYLVLGALMDPISMMVITVPLVHPMVVGLGYDPIWFAIIMVKLVELSVITPPVGLNLFVVAAASRGLVSTRDVYQGVSFFILLELVTLVILLSVPQISLFLPNIMIR